MADKRSLGPFVIDEAHRSSAAGKAFARRYERRPARSAMKCEYARRSRRRSRRR